jgi:hypothetical protein
MLKDHAREALFFHERAIDAAMERRLRRNSTVREEAGSAMQRRRRN